MKRVIIPCSPGWYVANRYNDLKIIQIGSAVIAWMWHAGEGVPTALTADGVQPDVDGYMRPDGALELDGGDIYSPAEYENGISGFAVRK